MTDSVTAQETRDPSKTLQAELEDDDPAADRHRLRVALVDVYKGDTYRLLTDLADLLETSGAHVDRPTVEAHLERPLTNSEWSVIDSRYTAMTFDEHIGDAGTIRTDRIDDVLLRAGLPRHNSEAEPPADYAGAPLADAHHPWHSCARHRLACPAGQLALAGHTVPGDAAVLRVSHARTRSGLTSPSCSCEHTTRPPEVRSLTRAQGCRRASRPHRTTRL